MKESINGNQEHWNQKGQNKDMKNTIKMQWAPLIKMQWA